MDEVRKRDWQVFWQAFLRTQSVFVAALSLLALYGLWKGDVSRSVIAFLALGGLAWWVGTAYLRSTQRRFFSSRIRQLYLDVADRSKRMQEAILRAKKLGHGSFVELPKTVRRVEQNLYYALRRADLIAEEVRTSESPGTPKPRVIPHANDPQAQALLQMADRNVAEYTQALAGVWAAVERTEAQAMVFITTLDGLRVRMLGHRLAAKNVDLESMEFMSTMTETKMQLSAIDKALEEIELQPFPRMIAVSPPPTPVSERAPGLGDDQHLSH